MQGPTVLPVGVDGSCFGQFSLVYHFSLLSPSLCETARHTQRVFKPKTTNVPQKQTGSCKLFHYSNKHGGVPEHLGINKIMFASVRETVS